MCGIFGYLGSNNNTPEIVLTGLKLLEYRGYDSWGVAVVPKNNIEKIEYKKRIGKIGNANVSDMAHGNLAFGHTRWATHGKVTQVNSHPHLDCHDSIAVVHNGIVENFEHIKNELIAEGHNFISETDTEVVAHCIEQNIQKGLSFDKSVIKTFRQIKGLNAILAVSCKTNEIAAIKNSSPLVVGRSKNEIVVASDPAAILKHTKNVYFLEDYELAIASPNGLKFYNLTTNQEFKPSFQKLSWSFAQSTKGDYPDFMLKEIHEQPAILDQILHSTISSNVINNLLLAKNIHLLGCGSASFVSLAGSFMFSEISKKQVSCSIGSEFDYNLKHIGSETVVLAVSQSGETMDIIEPVKKAKSRNAGIVALVNVLGSTLYRLADYKILINAGPEKAVASTKVVTAKLAHLILLTHTLAMDKDKGIKLVKKAIKSTKDVLTGKNITRIKKLAKKFHKTKHVFVVGKGISIPASFETALKIKEISYIHAEGLPAGELKHGTLALIEKNRLCIVFLPNDETYQACLASAMEMKARGGVILGISHKPHPVFDYYLRVMDAGKATIIPNIVTGQLLAYYLTKELGYDADMPRNLAKSVTVK